MVNRKDKALRKLRKEIRAGIYSYLVLKILESGEMHGYAIRKLFESLTSGKFVPSEGALYDILKSLQKQGLVKGFWVMDARPRKCYRLTELGRKVLKELKEEITLLKGVIENLEEVEK